jgi:sterol 3beta-glucosyltransferase
MVMKIVLSSRGSRGDVFPIIEIAAALQNHGHEAGICVPQTFEHTVKSRGLRYSLYSEDSGQVMQKLGSGIQAIRTALDWFSSSIEEQFEFMLGATQGADAMATSVNEVAAPTVAEYRGIPHFRIAYTPVLPGYQPPPLIPWQRMPGTANRIFWHLVNGSTGLLIGKYINAIRKRLGLRPMPSTGSYFTARSHTILAINPTLAPPCASWFERYDFSYAGYCYGSADEALEPELVRFLQKGPPPVYIGFGSVIVKNPEGFTSLTLEAAEIARCRLILGKGWTGLGLKELPGHVFPVGDTNHAALFPRCAGVAHHGGSGTTHTAARAGVPQFIMPQIADQFYWGHRVRRLGLGPAPKAPDKLTAKRLGKVFAELLNNPCYARNAKYLGNNMRFENGVHESVGIITSSLKNRMSLEKSPSA